MKDLSDRIADFLDHLADEHKLKDVVQTIVDEIDNLDVDILDYISEESIIWSAINESSIESKEQLLDEVKLDKYCHIYTTSLDKQRMLLYLKEHIEDITLEGLEHLITNKIR